MKSQNDISDLKVLAHQLDSKFRLPLGIKIGWDGILGFIPGIGDLLTNSASFYIMYRAAMVGCPPSVIGRMALNVLIDNIIDLVPIIGNFFDFFWKSNQKNITLVELYLTDPKRTQRNSRMVLFSSLLIIFALLISVVAITVFVAAKLFQFLREQSNW